MSDTAAEAAILAKQALKDMALAQAAPTPDNFRRYYEGARAKLTGSAPPPTREREADASRSSLVGVLGIVETFLANLGDLYPDNPSLKEQVEILRDVLLAPEDLTRLSTARKALARMRAPQIHSHLSAAKMVARQMSDLFIEQMGLAGDATGALVDRLLDRQSAIEGAKSKKEIALAVVEMVAEARAARSALDETKLKMLHTRARAEEALSSIRDLESRLIKASEDAKRDYLTGLLNRRGLDEELTRVFTAEAASFRAPTLALLDIDNFKAINDTLGHEGGDRALKTLSAAIKEILAGKGSPARMGGEEFLLVFPDLSATEAKKAVQGLQRSLTTKYFMEAEGERLITFSAGVAQRLQGETPASTIARADEAMYTAKRRGKNRVEISPKNEPPSDDPDPGACLAPPPPETR